MSSKKGPDTRTTRCLKCGSEYAKRHLGKREVPCCVESNGVISAPTVYSFSWNGSLFSLAQHERVSMPMPEVRVASPTMKMSGIAAGQLCIFQCPDSETVEVCRIIADEAVPFLDCSVKRWNPVNFVRITLVNCAIFEASEITVSCENQVSSTARFHDFANNILTGIYCCEGQLLTIRYFGKTVYASVVEAKGLTCIQNEKVIKPEDPEIFEETGLGDVSLGVASMNISGGSDVFSSPRTPSSAESRTPLSPADTTVCFLNYDYVKCIYRITETTKIHWSPRNTALATPAYTSLGDLSGFEREKELLKLHLVGNMQKGAKAGCRMLLYGASGTGKTALLCGVQMELSGTTVIFFSTASVSPAEISSKLAGLFKTLAASVPSALLIDDFDFPAGSEQTQQRCQLLSNLMDEYCEQGVNLVLATKDADSLSSSLRRRFDVEIAIAAPGQPARFEMLRKIEPTLTSDDCNTAAAKTHGYTPSDLVCLVRHAARLALSSGESLALVHLEQSLKFVRPSAMREIILEVPEVRWTDIGGMEALKNALRQIVEWPLKHPEAFSRLGISPLKGVLFYGPPGCCKTMAARALATESGMNFLSVKGPELFSKWVGESEKTVRELFGRARAASPSIVFFDEIDAIGASRGSDGNKSTVGDRVLAQLLTEMDGIEPLANVVIVAATNRPDTIDPALLRPGRFDRLIYMPLPDLETREEIIKVQLKKIPVSFCSDDERENCLKNWATVTEGYSGAEIASIYRDAAMISLSVDLETTCVSTSAVEQAITATQRGVSAELLLVYERFRSSRM